MSEEKRESQQQRAKKLWRKVEGAFSCGSVLNEETKRTTKKPAESTGLEGPGSWCFSKQLVLTGCSGNKVLTLLHSLQDDLSRTSNLAVLAECFL